MSNVLAREPYNWLSHAEGWLMDKELDHMGVFDLFDLLTDYGQSNRLRYATDELSDNLPSGVRNEKADEFVPCLNRAVHR